MKAGSRVLGRSFSPPTPHSALPTSVLSFWHPFFSPLCWTPFSQTSHPRSMLSSYCWASAYTAPLGHLLSSCWKYHHNAHDSPGCVSNTDHSSKFLPHVFKYPLTPHSPHLEMPEVPKRHASDSGHASLSTLSPSQLLPGLRCQPSGSLASHCTCGQCPVSILFSVLSPDPHAGHPPPNILPAPKSDSDAIFSPKAFANPLNSN